MGTDQSVLVVGGGSSGIDIVSHLGKTAGHVTFSQHKIPNEKKEDRQKREDQLPSNTKLQDEVKHFTSTGAEFIDGSHQAFDSVIFATGITFYFNHIFNIKWSIFYSKLFLACMTNLMEKNDKCCMGIFSGYRYSFRFLSAECGIHVDNNFIQPLYKQVLNINHPTMAFICVIMSACYNYVSDLQVSFNICQTDGS